MGNPLTGEFDIVAEFGVEAVNRVLAAQHQSSGPDQIYLHSVRTIVRADVVEGVWGIAEIQVSTPTISLPAESGQPVVATFAPTPASVGLALGPVEDVEPTVGLAPDTDLIFRRKGSRVTLHFDVRVRFRPDSGSSNAPEFVHGELRITVSADQVISPSENVVTINLDANDLAVSFTPAAGASLSSAERAIVIKAARHFIRKELGAVNLRIELPSGTDEFSIRHWRFKTLPHNSRPAVALLLNMRPGRIPAPAQRESYDNNFLKSSDNFAFAIGSDFLVPALRSLLREQIQQKVDGRSYTVDLQWPVPDVTYEIRLSKESPKVTLEPGAIKIGVKLDATSNRLWAPDVSLELTQRVGLDVSAGVVTLTLVGEPIVDLDLGVAQPIEFLFENKVKNAVSTALEQAVNAAQPLLRKTLSGAKGLTEKLRIPPPQLTYSAVDISTAGIIVHGDLAVAEWEPVVVAFDSRRLLPDPPQRPKSQLEYTALRSWIPGGTIRRFRWLLDTGVSTETRVREHQFTLQPGSRIQTSFLWASWCLEVSGVQDGKAVVGSNCGLIGPPVVAWPGNGAGTGAGNEDPPLPVSVVNAAGNLVAHVDLSRDRPGRRRRDPGPANVLVHFAGSESEATLAVMRELLPQLDLEGKSLLVISVLRPGALTPARVNESLEAPNVYLVWAEDFEGGWAKAFQAREGRPAFLVTPPDGLAWRSSAQPDARELAKALKRYLKTTELPPLRMLRPGVREYEHAPNLEFDYIPGTKMKLSTLRGRPVHICFVKSWSKPCLSELRRLQMLHERQGERGGVVLAVVDGQEACEVQTLFRQYRFGFRIVADPERQIARRYGIVAWPTTITVGPGGLVRGIRLGTGPVPEASKDHQPC